MKPTILIVEGTTLHTFVIMDNIPSPFVYNTELFEKTVDKVLDITDYRDILVSMFGNAFLDFNYSLMRNGDIIDYIITDMDEEIENEKQTGIAS